MQDSVVFLSPWKLIWIITRDKHLSADMFPNDILSLLEICKANNLMRAPWPSGGTHTAATRHSQLGHWWLENCHTPLTLFCAQPYVYLARLLLLYNFHSQIPSSYSFISTGCVCPLTKAWNLSILLGREACFYLKPVNKSKQPIRSVHTAYEGELQWNLKQRLERGGGRGCVLGKKIFTLFSNSVKYFFFFFK